MPDKYDAAAERWAQGMRSSKPYADQRREAQRAVMLHNRAEGAKRPCGIKGCKRHTYKARLCRKHYDLVPHEHKVRTVMACFNAQLRAASKEHQRYLKIAQAIVDAAP